MGYQDFQRAIEGEMAKELRNAAGSSTVKERAIKRALNQMGQAYPHRLYSSGRFVNTVATGAVAAQEVNLFSVGLKDAGQGFTTNLTRFETNLTEGGKLPVGYAFEASACCVRVEPGPEVRACPAATEQGSVEEMQIKTLIDVAQSPFIIEIGEDKIELGKLGDYFDHPLNGSGFIDTSCRNCGSTETPAYIPGVNGFNSRVENRGELAFLKFPDNHVITFPQLQTFSVPVAIRGWANCDTLQQGNTWRALSTIVCVEFMGTLVKSIRRSRALV